MHDIVHAAARFLTRVAAVFLLAMMMLNVVDVGLKNLFNAPIFGTYEVVELLLGAVAFLAIPEVFLRDQHIKIELIDEVIPDRVVDWLRVTGAFAALVFVGLLAWHMVQPAIEFYEFNDVTMDLHIPIIWKAVFILAGVAFSVIAAFVMLLRDIAKVTGRAE